MSLGLRVVGSPQQLMESVPSPPGEGGFFLPGKDSTLPGSRGFLRPGRSTVPSDETGQARRLTEERCDKLQVRRKKKVTLRVFRRK